MNNKYIIGFIILSFILGIAISQVYNFIYPKKDIERRLRGYWKSNSKEPQFEYGDWVCVNVQGITYQRAVEVCQHEVGHEIFAEICEKNITKCFEVVENEE